MGRTVKTITTDQAEKLLTHLATTWTTDRDCHTANRNYLIALLMLDTGIRVGELVQLVRADLVTNGQPTQTLTIRDEIAKRHHERTIPTSKRIRSGIELFTVKAWWGRENLNTTAAFHSHHSYKALSTRQVENIIGKATEKSIGEWIHPHCLRHTFASRLMRTTNIRIVQELLGHKNLSSTQIYTHPNSNDLRKAIDSITE